MNKYFIVLTIFFLGYTQAQNNVNLNKKIVIAHRGASGYLPEHTMEAKAMAYAMHPDFIEQDLVLSKDNIPIVIHDIRLNDVTDVEQKYSDRKRADGFYYVIDFTYSELLQLHVNERINIETSKVVYPKRFPLKKSRFKLHSLQDEIELIQGLNQSTGNNIGIYPEIKNPEFHRKNGKDISNIVLEILSGYGYKTKSDNCILQCFDYNELKRVRFELKSELFLVQLIGWNIEDGQLKEYSNYADGIGPSIKHLVDGFDQKGNVIFTDLVKNAHKLNLKVHAFTFRADELNGIPTFEKLLELGLYGAGVDGLFTDFPDKVVGFLKNK
jgi:glycerophosphoryl diester phosphodiesterase